jgi:hypothetical protein
LLPFRKAFKPRAFDRAYMNEDVFAAFFTLDKSKPLA